MFARREIDRGLTPTVIAIVAAQYCFGQFPGVSTKPKGQWMDETLAPYRRAELVLNEMTLDEKIQLIHGTGIPGFSAPDPSAARSNGGGGFVPGIARVGLPDLNMNGGSLGSGGSAHKGRYSTGMPSFLALASSWNTAVARDFGALVRRELADQASTSRWEEVWTSNAKPETAAIFEYLGEDPILAGNLVAQSIQGVQSQGVIGDIKHYAVNDQETGRYL